MGVSRILMSKQQPQQALSYLQQAAKVDPLNTEAHYRLALVYRSLHKAEEAQQEMKLYQEIRRTKEHVKELYKQMNATPTREMNAEPD
jgi:Tfp pilus assembly protein PilF